MSDWRGKVGGPAGGFLVTLTQMGEPVTTEQYPEE
jgi:hypothetical protein